MYYIKYVGNGLKIKIMSLIPLQQAVVCSHNICLIEYISHSMIYCRKAKWISWVGVVYPLGEN